MQKYKNQDIDPVEWTWAPGNFSPAYGQEFSYDPSGNILTQDRLDHTGSSSGLIDELEYHYYPGTNRLEYVTNAQTGGANNQVPDQEPENYIYDESGNLVFDESEDLNTIHWTPYGKVGAILRYLNPSGNAGEILFFGYNSNQQRIKKQKIQYEVWLLEGEFPSRTLSEPLDLMTSVESFFSIDTLSTLWYIRDATGNVLAVYEQMGDTMHWKEQHLYGSSRLGMVLPDVVVSPLSFQKTVPHFVRNKEQPYGARRYEISNHLGNVTTVVSDRKVPIDNGGSNTYEAAVHSAMDYYPFGSLMTERTYSAGGYRYGFNTQEKDDEIKGEGNHYSAEFWQYDPRVIHRWNLDPRPNSAMSGYAILGGNPIWYSDPLGDTVKIEGRTGFLGLGKAQTLLYEGGSLFNPDGSAFEGRVRGLFKQSLGALNKIRDAEEGQSLLEELESSENVFTIKYGRANSFSALSPIRASANLSEVQQATGNTMGSSGTGGIINWNPRSREGGFNTAGNRYRAPFIGLAHELFHGRDANRGLLYPSNDYTNIVTGAIYRAEHGGLLKVEWRAVYYENVLRSQLGQPLRTHYSVLETSPGVYSPYGPLLIDDNNQPINYPVR